MPITTEWLVENRIVLSNYWGVITDEDALASNAAGLALCEQAPAGVLVHLIMNIHHGETNFSIFSQARLKLKKPPNAGWVIAVTRRNIIANMMTTAISHLVGLRLRQVHTYEEALRVLQELDDTLPDLSVYKEKAREN